MLEVNQVSVTRGGVRIISDISFDIRPGTFVSVLGANGAGKTTLVRALAGVIPAQGIIKIDGRSLHDIKPHERVRSVGYVGQNPATLASRATVLEMLIFSQNAHALGWRASPDAIENAKAILETLSLMPLAHMPVAVLSGGQKQMVCVALALVHRPRLLLLDEPTSALDIANQLRLLDTLHSFTKTHGAMTVAILHDLNLAARYGDAVLMLDHGTIAARGDAASVLTAERLRASYGVDCHILDTETARIIYPMRAAEV